VRQRSPVNGLAGNDKGARGWLVRPVREEPVCRGDQDEQRNRGQEIDLPGIVLAVVEFPTH
jgi:hypothetical protein